MIGCFPAGSAVANNEMTPEYGDPGSCRGPNTLKYRVVTVSNPYRSVNIRQYCSPTSFCNAYGDLGLVGMSSRLGSVGVSPYADEDVERRRDVGAVRREGIVHRPRHGRNRRLVEHVVHPGARSHGERLVGEVAFEKLRGFDDVEIRAFAGDEAVGNADTMPASEEFFREMRTDESRAAGDEV